MNFAEYGTLKQYLRNSNGYGGGLKESHIREITEQLLLAVDLIHRH